MGNEKIKIETNDRDVEYLLFIIFSKINGNINS